MVFPPHLLQQLFVASNCNITLSQQPQSQMLAEWFETKGSPEQQGGVSDAWLHPDVRNICGKGTALSFAPCQADSSCAKRVLLHFGLPNVRSLRIR